MAGLGKGGLRRDGPGKLPARAVNLDPKESYLCKKTGSGRTTLGVRRAESMPGTGPSQDSQFEQAIEAHGAALERLARAYEADPETRRDLLQEIHIALWRSLCRFDNRCSLRTWVYRVAHNTAASHVTQRLRMKSQIFVGIEELSAVPDRAGGEAVDQYAAVVRVYELIHQLKPLDRQVMLAYLEGMDAAATSEITGLSARNVATKIFRIKQVLKCRFQEGGRDER